MFFRRMFFDNLLNKTAQFPISQGFKLLRLMILVLDKFYILINFDILPHSGTRLFDTSINNTYLKQ